METKVPRIEQHDNVQFLFVDSLEQLDMTPNEEKQREL